MKALPDLANFSKEQLYAISKMKDLDEFMSYVNDQSIDLTDEQLEAISGGETDPGYEEYAKEFGKLWPHQLVGFKK